MALSRDAGECAMTSGELGEFADRAVGTLLGLRTMSAGEGYAHCRRDGRGDALPADDRPIWLPEATAAAMGAGRHFSTALPQTIDYERLRPAGR
jgi:hypothetical protein